MLLDNATMEMDRETLLVDNMVRMQFSLVGEGAKVSMHSLGTLFVLTV